MHIIKWQKLFDGTCLIIKGLFVCNEWQQQSAGAIGESSWPHTTEITEGKWKMLENKTAFLFFLQGLIKVDWFQWGQGWSNFSGILQTDFKVVTLIFNASTERNLLWRKTTHQCSTWQTLNSDGRFSQEGTKSSLRAEVQTAPDWVKSVLLQETGELTLLIL